MKSISTKNIPAVPAAAMAIIGTRVPVPGVEDWLAGMLEDVYTDGKLAKVDVGVSVEGESVM